MSYTHTVIHFPLGEGFYSSLKVDKSTNRTVIINALSAKNPDTIFDSNPSLISDRLRSAVA